MKREKIRVGLIFGGRSGEHEVSLASANAVFRALDKDKYEVVSIRISRDGEWLIADSPRHLLAEEVTPELTGASQATPDANRQNVVHASGRGRIDLHHAAVDVVFPLLHGPYGEDGTVQGLLELADIPYVGSGVLGSAVSMDKVMMKDVFRAGGIPVVPYRLVTLRELARDPDATADRLEQFLAYPMFVKPCNLGSSVGITKAHDREELLSCLDLAARYDARIIVEQGIEAREVECSVLGNDDPLVSVPGEIISNHEYYDYEAKYTEGLSQLVIPARISVTQTRRVQELAREAFHAVSACGLARVDFFMDKKTGEVIVNEINTIPGFTPTSMYPRLWEASGVPFSELVDRLIQLGIERQHEKSRRSTNRVGD